MTMLAPGSPADLADRARAGLHDRLGAAATLVARAPGRVNLIGEHTDYNGGLVLPVALPHATYVAVAPRRDRTVRLASGRAEEVVERPLDRLGPDDVTGWASYAGGVLWALQEAGFDVPGLDLYVESTVPLGAGLSSSAALECSVAMAAVGLAGIEVDQDVRDRIVRACIRAETEVAHAPTGGMDQTVSVHAGVGAALLVDFSSGEHHRVPLALVDRVILVTDTRVTHQLTDGGYGSRRADCERAAELLGVSSLRDATPDDLERLTRDGAPETLRRRAAHIVSEIARVPEAEAALATGDWGRLGRIFAASHASMRDDFEISTPELDLSVDSAVAAGADAARMTGGGFGGSTVALVRADLVDQVTAAVDSAFAAAGHPAPVHLLADPSEGAGVLGG